MTSDYTTTDPDRELPENDMEIARDTVTNSFEEADLDPELLKGIHAYGIERLSSNQKRTIIHILKGRDVIVHTNAGTGKTIASSICTLQMVDKSNPECQVLFLVATRELAQATWKVLDSLGNSMSIRCHPVIGGTKIREDITALSNGMQVVVGTPGRTLDLICRGALNTYSIKLLILDEADEIFSRGFGDHTYDMVQKLPSTIQTMLLSPTMPPDTKDFAIILTNNPIQILNRRSDLTLQGIKQLYVMVGKEDEKLDKLCDICNALAVSQIVVFCSTHRKVDILTEKLRSRDQSVLSINYNLEQSQRENIMKEFLSGSSRFLITTCLVAQEIDVQHVSLVINYDLPVKEDYIYCIGHWDHSSQKLAISIIIKGDDDTRRVREIEQYYFTQISEMPVDAASIL